MPLPRYVYPFLLLSVLSTLDADQLQPQEDIQFGLQLGSPCEVETPAPGAFRVSIEDGLMLGGGLARENLPVAIDLMSADLARGVPPAPLPQSFLSGEGVRLRWEGTRWTREPVQLPEAVAFAAVVPSEGGFLVIGGFRKEGLSARVTRWQWQEAGWKTEEMAALPRPLVFAGGVEMDGVLYIAGGTGPLEAEPALYSIELSNPEATWQTRPLAGLDGPWLQPQLAARKDEKAIQNALFVFGGWQRAPAPGNWAPVRSGFKLLEGWPLRPLKEAPAGRLLYAATPLGPSHLLAAAFNPDELTGFPALTDWANRPGTHFLRYHVFTDTWTNFTAGQPAPVTYIDWANKRTLLLGISDSAGRESLCQAEIVSIERHFSFIDYAVMALYLLGLVAIGKYFASRERSTEDFFLGGRRVPWWAAGLSIYATGTSAISFMAIPAKTYSTDWLYFIGMAIFPFFTVTIAAFVFVPLLRKLEITTVMEYFEMRFGRPVRLLMSAITVLGQVGGRMSITLLLPSIALTAVTGMNIYVCILVMGVLATLYTAVGGINAVIWTDVLQVVVLFGGALLSFALIIVRVDGGLGSMLTLAVQDNKFNLFDFRWDFTIATMWVMILWAVSDVFGKGLGQEALQRAFSTKGVREARRSMITCAVVALPAGFLFYGIGTALYSFYHAHPEMLNPVLQTDAIFPLFIAQQLPVGLAGLVISGLFAASMSTLDTAMNTSATILVRDFYSIWRKDKGDREQLLVAKLITLFCGAFGTGVALYMASFENLGSLWDLFSILLGVIGGGLGGVGLLAICTTRANTWGTLAGALVTAVCMVLIQRYTPVHFFIYGTVSMVIGGTSGYLFSLFIPAEKKDLTGLTLWTTRPRKGIQQSR